MQRLWIGSFTTQSYSWIGIAWTAAALRSGPRPSDRVRRGESAGTRLYSPCRSATSVGVRCSSISQDGAGASGSDMRSGQPENCLSKYPMRRSCAVPCKSLCFSRPGGGRVTTGGGGAGLYISADASPFHFDVFTVEKMPLKVSS